MKVVERSLRNFKIHLEIGNITASMEPPLPDPGVLDMLDRPNEGSCVYLFVLNVVESPLEKL